MSNALAIAAVTKTLHELLSKAVESELGVSGITVLPLDIARENNSPINLFLYHMQPNATWRNFDVPNRTKSGETGYPPLALSLYYLVTAYGRDNDTNTNIQDISAHRLLGVAMQALHDNTTLNPEKIRQALAESDLHNQIERVRLTPITLNLEEMSKLWATFQTQYRISVAYEASVVLIESRHPVRTPLPILQRGDRFPSGREGGLTVKASPVPPLPPFPTIEKLTLPNRQPGIQLGQTLNLQGHRFDTAPTDQIKIQFRHPRLEDPIEQPPSGDATDELLPVTLDVNEVGWLAGTQSVSAQFMNASPPQSTNALPFVLVPTLSLPVNSVTTLTDGSRQLTVNCAPQVWLWRHPNQPETQRGQQVSLLIGNRELRPVVEALPEVDADPLETAPQPAQKSSQLVFDISNLPPGDYWLRLRVDGADSLLVNWQADPLVFDVSQRLTLT